MEWSHPHPSWTLFSGHLRDEGTCFALVKKNASLESVCISANPTTQSKFFTSGWMDNMKWTFCSFKLFTFGTYSEFKDEGKEEKNRLMLEDYVNKHTFPQKNPKLSASNTFCWNVELVFEEKKNRSNCHVIETVKFKLKMARCL